ncbi:hypothetical protein APB26_32675 [Pseudomonas aeruginosa]|uniref:hypothetical protein n=1 Tax=Pseudomonas aeruginosa TaxID=287 RepID=UPI00071C1240|nr:hypothetical protein [Pseudomonas aeruginosa]KSQ21738.1 hypothetical protein APB26_32675 [Pseudomonas aeruginosa]RPV61411.1 hypothetical protein IPC838_19015 [Pseudomonas aeruginosa]
MTKTAVQVDLLYLEKEGEKGQENQTLRFQAVLLDGKLTSPEMYCHLYEWNSNRQVYEVQPGILTDEDGSCRQYLGEWGYGDKSDVTFEFLDRPLAVGQEITRTDRENGETHKYIYRITAITDLLA